MADFYLGSLGALRLIQAPMDPMEVSPALIGAVHESLTGLVSVDRVAAPRTFQPQWQVLTEDELTYLDAVGHGQVPGPLRLLDPLRRNRLSRQVASGGSLHRSTAGWAVDDEESAIDWAPITDPPTGVWVRGVIAWTIPAVSADDLVVASGRVSAADRVPVLPGETVRLTGYARGTVGTEILLGLDAWTLAGVSAATEDTLTVLDDTDWSALTVTYAVPGDGTRVAASPYLRAPAGQPEADVQITGFQIDEGAGAWTPGGGAPVVTATELGETYELVDKHTWTMTLREAAV